MCSNHLALCIQFLHHGMYSSLSSRLSASVSDVCVTRTSVTSIILTVRREDGNSWVLKWLPLLAFLRIRMFTFHEVEGEMADAGLWHTIVMRMLLLQMTADRSGRNRDHLWTHAAKSLFAWMRLKILSTQHRCAQKANIMSHGSAFCLHGFEGM